MTNKELKINVKTVGFNGGDDRNKRLNESVGFVEKVVVEDKFLKEYSKDGRISEIEVCFTKTKAKKGFTMSVTIKLPKQLGGTLRIEEVTNKDENIGEFFVSKFSEIKQKMTKIVDKNKGQKYDAKNKQKRVAKRFGLSASEAEVTVQAKNVAGVEEENEKPEPSSIMEVPTEWTKDGTAPTTGFENIDALINLVNCGTVADLKKLDSVLAAIYSINDIVNQRETVKCVQVDNKNGIRI